MERINFINADLEYIRADLNLSGSSQLIIIEISGKDIKKEYDTTKPVGDMGRAADYSLAYNTLGWKPKVSIEEGLTSHSYLRSHGEI